MNVNVKCPSVLVTQKIVAIEFLFSLKIFQSTPITLLSCVSKSLLKILPLKPTFFFHLLLYHLCFWGQFFLLSFFLCLRCNHCCVSHWKHTLALEESPNLNQLLNEEFIWRNCVENFYFHVENFYFHLFSSTAWGPWTHPWPYQCPKRLSQALHTEKS